MTTVPDEQAIRDYAYRLWETEGKPEGRDDEFWQRACGELNEPKDLLIPQDEKALEASPTHNRA